MRRRHSSRFERAFVLNERKCVANVGSSLHDEYVELITDLIYNAGISCDMPPN